MARTPEQRGPFGRWLVGERKARGWTADQMRARLQEARGFAMAHSTYALLESGQRQPTDEQARHLTAFLGSEPEPTPAPASDLSALIARLDAQAATIDRLAESIKLLADALAAATGTPPGAPTGASAPAVEPLQDAESAALAVGRLESAGEPTADLRVVPPAGMQRRPGR
jgi:transcriptional regulator with XRE-family HTH domain